jgi:hypothetical protein
MALGKAGSSLTQELNRLAGITDVALYLDAQGAANKYANTTGKGIIGALNIKAAGVSIRQPSAYKALNGICNELAGTTGKSASDALRSINV